MEAVSAAAEVSVVASADLEEAPSVAEEAVLPGNRLNHLIVISS
jgi:hypothetical protein